MIRRTLARWLCLSTILLTRGVSVVAKKRFPTLDHLITAGLMNKEEKELFENVTVRLKLAKICTDIFIQLVYYSDSVRKILGSDALVHGIVERREKAKAI